MELLLLLGCVLVALALLAVPLSARLPKEGIRSWLRSTLGSAREPLAPMAEAEYVGIDELLVDDPSVPGYVTPEQLRGRVTGLRGVLTR